MRYFISGGCKNGKSFLAQQLAKSQATSSLYYIATMLPSDQEDQARVNRHKQDRDGWGFTTIEQPTHIEEVISKCPPDSSILLDSLTALLANEMFTDQGLIDSRAADRIAEQMTMLSKTYHNLVIVSDYIYSDAGVFDPLTEQYRVSLARLDRLLARLCDVVLEVVYGNVVTHKGVYHPEVLGKNCSKR